MNEQPDRINSTEEGSLASRLILRRRESHWESRAKEGKGRRRFGFGGLPSPVSFQPATSNVASSSSEIKIGCRKLPPKRHFASLAPSLRERRPLAVVWSRRSTSLGTIRIKKKGSIPMSCLQNVCILGPPPYSCPTDAIQSPKKSLYMVGRSWGRRGKQQQEENSPNHVQRLF